MASPAPPTALDDDSSWHRYRIASNPSVDVLYETDLAGVIQWISPSVQSLLGWDPAALVGGSLHDLVHPEDSDRIAALRKSFFSEGTEHAAVRCMVRTAAGGYREMTLTSRPLADAEQVVTGAIITLTDTHDRDAALRALATLSQANRALVRATDEDDLLDRMCRALVETGRYALAWYGRAVDDDSQSVGVVASAGRVDYLAQVTVSWGDNPHGHGPAGRCLRTGTTQVQNRLAGDPAYQPWSEAAAQHGFCSTIVLPVRVHEDIDGALMVYAHEPGSFDALAQDLLEDLAADLGYGIERTRSMVALARTTELESEQRQRLQSTLDSMIDPLILMDGVRDGHGALVDLRYADANQAAIDYNRIPRQELVGARLLDLFPGQLEHGPLRQYFHTIETGEPTILDGYAYSHEVLGQERRYDIRATRCGDGIALTWRDVTERHQATQALAEGEQQFRLLAENSSDVVVLRDEHLRILWASPSTASVLGVAAADAVGRSVTEFVDPEDVEGMNAQITAASASGIGLHYRIRVRTGSGDYRWFEGRNRPLAAPAGEPRQWVVSLQDIHEQVHAETELAASEELFRLLAENSSDVIILADLQEVTALWVSPSVERTLGWRPDEILGRSPADLIHPDDLQAAMTQFSDTWTEGDDLRQTYRVRCADGGYRWIEAVARVVGTDDDGRVVVRLRDIDQQVRAEQGLAAREELYRLLAENASDVVLQVSPEGRVTWVSPAVRSVLGWEVDDMVGMETITFVHPEDRARVQLGRLDLASGRPADGEFRIQQADGSYLWTALSVHPVQTDAGFARIVSLRDIHVEVEARSQLDFVLRHDQSTGLPTRAAVADILHDELSRTDDPQGIAVLSIGIDVLKDVNEAYGHAAGDVVVATVAARVVEAVGRTSLVGRGTGDEFTVVLTGIPDPAEAASVAERVRVAVHGDVALEDRTVSPTVSIGIAIGTPGGSSEALQQEATLALHRAKELGRDRWAFADAELARTAARRMALESAIREGIDNHEFQPWFQPIVSLSDDAIVGYEALIRWKHSDQVMDPSQFLDVAMRTPMITDLDLAMVEPVVSALAARPSAAFIAVNVTGLTLARTDYASYVSACLAQHDVSPSRLHVEITETMLLGLDDDVVAQITALASLGVRWYVDDFGTGYSSISHLRDLPVSGLKLDASFTAGIGAGSDTSRQLAVALLGLANGLGLDTVAEGIESRAEADYLRTLGWRHGQGWLYGKAAPLP
jgi:diguanylate cyclase (GGDEF)-like protein/PAS domain S-box-containing protein